MTLFVDNSILKMTMENSKNYKFNAKFTISYIGDGEFKDACTPYLGDTKIWAKDYIIQGADTNQVRLYIMMNIGLDKNWPLGWDVHVDVTDPSGEEYVIQCHFRQGTFGEGTLN